MDPGDNNSWVYGAVETLSDHVTGLWDFLW